jgi:hypothetical protein
MVEEMIGQRGEYKSQKKNEAQLWKEIGHDNYFDSSRSPDRSMIERGKSRSKQRLNIV